MSSADPEARERAEVVREPSLPLACYSFAHVVGIDKRNDREFADFIDLSKAALSGEIPSRPSRLREYAMRALHTLGFSRMSDEEMQRFVSYCHGDDIA